MSLTLGITFHCSLARLTRQVHLGGPGAAGGLHFDLVTAISSRALRETLAIHGVDNSSLTVPDGGSTVRSVILDELVARRIIEFGRRFLATQARGYDSFSAIEYFMGLRESAKGSSRDTQVAHQGFVIQAGHVEPGRGYAIGDAHGKFMTLFLGIGRSRALAINGKNGGMMLCPVDSLRHSFGGTQIFRLHSSRAQRR